MLKKIISLILIFYFVSSSTFANVVVDDSIHVEISEKYNLNRLPDLPENISNEVDIFTPNETDTLPSSKYVVPKDSLEEKTISSSKKKTPKKVYPTSSLNTNSYKSNNSPFLNTISTEDVIKISKGKKFKAVNTTVLSDRLRKGSVVSFVTTAPEIDKYITIPKGSVFKGTVIDSHTPKITGNGGLLVIKVDTLVYKGRNYHVNAKVTLANDKKIFFNNIKGKRLYWHNLFSSTKKGKSFFNKMWAKTKKYFKPGIEIIVSPIAFVSGTVVYAANVAISPVMALFSKGGRLIIPENSSFEIKLLEDGIIYY